MDRGGLKHVGYTTFMLFVSMEKELRCHLQPSNVSNDTDVKKRAVDSIISNDDVLLHWSILSGNWQEEEAGLLITMIIDHWITIRGFSFASAFMERHKQEHKKSLQKSKGIRKALYEKKIDDKNKVEC